MRRVPIGEEAPQFGPIFTCLTSDVGKLTNGEAELLIAVQSIEKRLFIYVENRHHLEFGKILKVGDDVLVKDTDGNEVPGTVQFKGPHLTPGIRPGTWFRVKLKVG